MSFTISNRPLQLQRLVHQSNRINPQWLPVLLLRIMGYSSFATAIVSIAVYWYKKQLAYQQQQQQRTSNEIDAATLDEDQLHMNPRKRLQVTTNKNALMMMKRSSSTFTNLSNQNRQLFTPPPSPLSLPSSASPTSATSIVSSRSASPLGSWSSRLLDGVISNIRGKKKLTISLKNTVLWNPSRDVNNPNHAFHENTVSLLNKLAQVYDTYVIIHMNSDEERHQIHQLLVNANLLNPLVIDEYKVLWCSSEQGKLHVISHINPSIHVEGGWENDDGHNIIEKLQVERMIWIGHQQKGVPMNSIKTNVEIADQILYTSIAKQVGFC